MSAERRRELGVGHHRDRGRPGSGSQGSDDFFGIDMEGMSPKAQAVTGLVVGGVILAGVGLVLVLNPQFFWLVFVFGWVIFPALGLFARGVAGLAESRPEPLPADGQERELLEALHERGELTPAQAAMDTSLTVAEADEMLDGLAKGGHLDVRVRGGGLFYALWEHEENGRAREVEDR